MTKQRYRYLKTQNGYMTLINWDKPKSHKIEHQVIVVGGTFAVFFFTIWAIIHTSL